MRSGKIGQDSAILLEIVLKNGPVVNRSADDDVFWKPLTDDLLA